jgi:hypothetical protein
MNPEIEHALRTQNIGSLDEIQAGHWVLVGDGRIYSVPQPKQVTKVTKTQIIIGESKFNRETGRETGKSNYPFWIDINHIDGGNNRIKVDLIKDYANAIYRDAQQFLSKINQSDVEKALATLSAAYTIVHRILKKDGE